MGQLTATEGVENYPGFPDPILGQKLAQDLEDQAKLFVGQLEPGYVVTDCEHAPALEGALAAGDVVAKSLPRVATTFGDDALAAYQIHRYPDEQSTTQNA